jgi:hypothetical protein
MKIQAYIILFFLALTAHTMQAQSPVVFKYKYDPSYSVHNYKHPNKAALAKKHELDPLITLEYNRPTVVLDKAHRNYKVQRGPIQRQPSGAAIPVTPQKERVNSMNSPANYKHPFKR